MYRFTSHLQAGFANPINNKILDVALLRLRFCSIMDGKSDLNPSVKHGTLMSSVSLNFFKAYRFPSRMQYIAKITSGNPKLYVRYLPVGRHGAPSSKCSFTYV